MDEGDKRVLMCLFSPTSTDFKSRVINVVKNHAQSTVDAHCCIKHS